MGKILVRNVICEAKMARGGKRKKKVKKKVKKKRR